jgi:competence protein ComEA
MKLEKILWSLQDFTSEQKRAIALFFLIMLGFSSYLFIATRGDAVELPTRVEVSQPATKMIYIHVAGKVKRPGVYPLLEGSRVGDAIKAAGGQRKGISLDQVNLARLLRDGEQIYLTKVAGNPISSMRKSSQPRSGSELNRTININRATASDFLSLPGVGPVIAARIIEYRKTVGPFLDINDLLKVSGIGSKTFAQMKARLTL